MQQCEDVGEQLEILDLFKMEAENFGVWNNADPYADWKRFIDGEVSDSLERNYVSAEEIRLYEQGDMNSPQEALGKTWQHRVEYSEVSLDAIREGIAGTRGDQSKNGQVLQLAKERLKEGLRKKRNIIWDSTGLRRDNRSMVSGLAHDYHGLS